jgi:hypothetical protein
LESKEFYYYNNIYKVQFSIKTMATLDTIHDEIHGARERRLDKLENIAEVGSRTGVINMFAPLAAMPAAIYFQVPPEEFGGYVALSSCISLALILGPQVIYEEICEHEYSK